MKTSTIVLSFLATMWCQCGPAPRATAPPATSTTESSVATPESQAQEADTSFSFDVAGCTNKCVASKPFKDDPGEEAFTYCSEQCQDVCADECTETRDPGRHERDDAILQSLPSCEDDCQALF